MAVIYLMLFLISIALIKINYNTIFVPLTIICTTWCLFPSLATFGVLGLYEISSTTHFYILLSYFTFFIATFFSSKRNTHQILKDEDTFNNNISGNYINYSLLFWANALVAIWLFTKLGQSLDIIRNYGFVYLRNVYEDNFSASTIVNIIYLWFAKPIVVGSCAIFCLDVIRERNRNQIRVGIIILVNVLLDTIIFAARATLVKLVVYFLLAIFFCEKKSYLKKTKSKVILLVTLLMIVVVLLTGQRNSDSYAAFSFLDSLFMYYVAPFGLLNYYVMHPEFSLLGFNNMLYGKGMFGALYNCFRSALYVLFGFEYKGSDYITQLVTQQTIKVGTRVSINSACTADYIFLRDFGFIGIIIGFSMFAFIIEKIRKEYSRFPTIRNGALYICLLYVVFRLSASYDFLTPSTLFSILFILIDTTKPKVSITMGKMRLRNDR